MDPSIMDFSTAAMRSVTKRDYNSPTRAQVLASRKRREVRAGVNRGNAMRTLPHTTCSPYVPHTR